MFRVIRLVAIVLLSALAISACRPVQAPATAEPAAAARIPAELEEALAGKYEGKTVSFGDGYYADMPIFKEFQAKTGITIDFESIDPDGLVFQHLVNDSNGPDLADFYYLGQIRQYAKDGKIIDINQFVDRATLESWYDPTWLDRATMEGPSGPILAAAWGRYNPHSLVWYPKAAFEKAGYQAPSTWEDLLALSGQIVKDGGLPWCLGNAWDTYEGNYGYLAALWIGDILLRTTPPEVTTQFMQGELKFDSPEVRHAVELVADLWFKPGYAMGGRQAINTTSFFEGGAGLLEDPPKCWMMLAPGWLPDWEGQPGNPYNAKEFGKDYAFFVLPPIDTAYGSPVQVDAQYTAMFHDRPEVRALVEYILMGAPVENWAKMGKWAGNSARNNAEMDWYGDGWLRAEAEAAMAAQKDGKLHYVAGQTMWPEVRTQFYQSIADYIDGKVDLDTALKQIDAVAAAE